MEEIERALTEVGDLLAVTMKMAGQKSEWDNAAFTHEEADMDQAVFLNSHTSS